MMNHVLRSMLYGFELKSVTSKYSTVLKCGALIVGYRICVPAVAFTVP